MSVRRVHRARSQRAISIAGTGKDRQPWVTSDSGRRQRLPRAHSRKAPHRVKQMSHANKGIERCMLCLAQVTDSDRMSARRHAGTDRGVGGSSEWCGALWVGAAEAHAAMASARGATFLEAHTGGAEWGNSGASWARRTRRRQRGNDGTDTRRREAATAESAWKAACVPAS
ncbi:hypothetical protein ERJ75_000898000 [Trypanosoma vivax]|nr:hypothetical protein ERJ75_000898000 [Trypanosoma vivax]